MRSEVSRLPRPSSQSLSLSRSESFIELLTVGTGTKVATCSTYELNVNSRTDRTLTISIEGAPFFSPFDFEDFFLSSVPLRRVGKGNEREGAPRGLQQSGGFFYGDSPVLPPDPSPYSVGIILLRRSRSFLPRVPRKS